jgi:hypothetical protein
MMSYVVEEGDSDDEIHRCKRSQANITNYADITLEMLEIKLTKFVNTFKTK